jgi:hypothetical protein
MRVAYENFGLANILRVMDDHGNPIKILLDGGDGGIVGVTAAGRIIHVPPNSPVEEEQGVVAYMHAIKSSMLPNGKIPILTPCDVIDSEIALVESEMLSIAEAGGDPSILDAQLKKLLARAATEHCPPVRIKV